MTSSSARFASDATAVTGTTELWEEDDDEPQPPSVVGPNGVRLLAEQCSTCIFRTGNLMHLNAGRLKDMLDEVRATDSYVICHQSLDREVGDICKGSNDAHYGQLMRMADRMQPQFVELVQPQEKKGNEAHDSL